MRIIAANAAILACVTFLGSCGSTVETVVLTPAQAADVWKTPTITAGLSTVPASCGSS